MAAHQATVSYSTSFQREMQEADEAIAAAEKKARQVLAHGHAPRATESDPPRRSGLMLVTRIHRSWPCIHDGNAGLLCLATSMVCEWGRPKFSIQPVILVRNGRSVWHWCSSCACAAAAALDSCVAHAPASHAAGRGVPREADPKAVKRNDGYTRRYEARTLKSQGSLVFMCH